MHRRESLHYMARAVGFAALASASPERLLAVGRLLQERRQVRSTQGQDLLVLDAHQNRTVTTMAEHIIPETDTPGARAARVNEFIDLILAEWFEHGERLQFLRGLANVDERSLDLFGTVFVQATEPQQVALLSGLDAEAVSLRAAGVAPDGHFFSRMKWLTLYGYYTSEIGQIQELQASVIPGGYDPCGPVQRDTPGEW